VPTTRAARGVEALQAYDQISDEGAPLVRALSGRLSRFAWAHMEHDVLKVVYESAIPAQQRKQLGEYYTPDWLAERIGAATIVSPLES